MRNCRRGHQGRQGSCSGADPLPLQPLDASPSSRAKCKSYASWPLKHLLLNAPGPQVTSHGHSIPSSLCSDILLLPYEIFYFCSLKWLSSACPASPWNLPTLWIPAGITPPQNPSMWPMSQCTSIGSFENCCGTYHLFCPVSCCFDHRSTLSNRNVLLLIQVINPLKPATIFICIITTILVPPTNSGMILSAK